MSDGKRDAIETLSARLRELRERAGLSQAELAAAASTSVHSVAKLERGERFPSLRLARDVAAALGCSIDALCEPAGTALKPRGKGRPKRISEKLSD